MSDPLTDAPLTTEQRQAWDLIRAELIIARESLQEMETRIRALEHRASDEERVLSILTRPEFNREVARMLAFDERYGGQSSVLYFSVENLTDIIAQKGRDKANAAVRTACDTFARNIRNSDILGRLAVDEFGILLPRCDNVSAWKKGETLVTALQRALTGAGDFDFSLSISYGAYTFNDDKDVAAGLKRAASSMTRSPEGPKP